MGDASVSGLLLVLVCGGALLLLPHLSLLRITWRLLLGWMRGESRGNDVLEAAIRLRQLFGRRVGAEFQPRFWVSVELDTMPERQLLNICAAYVDLQAAGLSHEQCIERLEIWRSRFGPADMGIRHRSLGSYLAYRIRQEYPALPALPPNLFRIMAWLMLRHARTLRARRRPSLMRVATALKRKLYTLRVQGPDLALLDAGQPIAIGWTDLERYLESDTIAVRVLDGDEIWSYSSSQAAGLAVVRSGRVVQASELASFRNRRPARRRPNSAH
jgi:hypothetical protein